MMTTTSSQSAFLNREQVEFFAREGYLVLHQVLDPLLVTQARKLFWSCMPAHFNPEDPATWTGEVEDTGGRLDLAARHGRVKLRGELRREPLLLDLLPRNPRVRAAAECLLGEGRLREITNVRGIYCTFPVSPQEPLYGHVDLHPYSMGVLGYIDEVEARGGGLVVWPGTHRQSAIPVCELQRVKENRAVEITGQAGDAILYHNRLIHAPGHNVGSRVRQAVLCDFRDLRLRPQL